MNRKIFLTCVRYFGQHKNARNTLHFIYKVLPLLMFVAYPAMLVYAFFTSEETLSKLVTVPLGVFIGVTALRVIINEERPYERYGEPSVFRKETVGKSFPSRHTASAFIIAMAFLSINVPLGIAALCIALLIEVSRILAGAHYIHDVAGGMVISVVCGYFFFFLL